MAQIDADVPKTGGYWAIGRPTASGGGMEWRVFTSLQLAPLHQDAPATPHLLADLIAAST